MDRLQEIEVFAAVADAGGLARAAVRLRISPPAVTRAVASLEDRLGTRLFNRTTRSLALTEAGRQFLIRARRILADLDDAQKEVAGGASSPQGHLTITASVTFGRSILAPLVCSFLKENPRVSVSVLLLDRVASLVEEGIDLAVRIGALPDSGMIARKVGEVRRVLVASPGYVERNGAPKTVSDLKRHDLIIVTGLMPQRNWRYHNGVRQVSLTLEPMFEINDALAALQAAERGHGIAPALSYMVHEQIREGKLVEVLADTRQPGLPVHIVYPQARLVEPKVRAFIDFATPTLVREVARVSLPWRGPPGGADTVPPQRSNPA